MATYSTNLALTLMATGEQSNTWGDTTNTNLGTLLEQAISGYVTQAITDGSSANTTITIPNGATGVARNMFIEMTGALTFSTTSLIVPANKKMYFIFNNTSGGFAVTVKVSGQTGILVPNGKKVVLTCNGTDIVEAHTAIVGNATMGGTLGVTGATTLSSTLGVTGLITSTGGITGGASSHTTGTFSSTLGVTGVATLGNGAILGTPASGTVTNLTGTASININGTVGATTPATGAFTTLSASGVLGVSHTSTGSTAAYFYNLSATGFGVITRGGGGTTEYIAQWLRYDGSERMTLTNTGLAVTGTGTFTPSGISSGIKITQYSDVATYGLVTFNGATGSATNAGISGGGGGSNVYVNAPSAGAIYQRINGVDVASLSSTGLAVTGTLSATGITTVAAGTAALPAIVSTTGTADTGLWFPAADTVAASTAGTERLRIDSSGNVGIGTNSPSAKLHSYATSGTTTTLGRFEAAIGSYTGTSLIAANTLGASSTYNLFSCITDSDGDAGGPFTKFLVRGDGLVLLGTTSAIDSETGLGVVNATSGNSVVTFRNSRNTSGDACLKLFVGSNCQNTSSYLLTGAIFGVANVIYIFGNGNVVNTNNSYGALSDVKLKENIVDATPKLADLMQVKVRSYNLIGSTTKQLGVIAQELETVFPAMVDESPDRDAENNVLETTSKSVKYSVFVPMLIKAMQEQQALITALTTRITALENK